MLIALMSTPFWSTKSLRALWTPYAKMWTLEVVCDIYWLTNKRATTRLIFGTYQILEDLRELEDRVDVTHVPYLNHNCRKKFIKSPHRDTVLQWDSEIGHEAGSVGLRAQTLAQYERLNSSIAVTKLRLTKHFAAVPLSILPIVGIIVSAFIALFHSMHLTLKYCCIYDNQEIEECKTALSHCYPKSYKSKDEFEQQYSCLIKKKVICGEVRSYTY